MVGMDSKRGLLEFQNSFPLFVGLVWKVIGLPKPTPIQVEIAKTLQYPPSNRYILEGFRGVAKSFIACAFTVWSLWRDPQIKVMIVSASKERADANASFIKKIINELPFLAHLKAREGQRDTQTIFDVGPAKPDHSPSVKSVGITGQLTGSRADLIIADDVEVPNNSATQTMRDKLSELVKEFDAILKPLPTSKIIYLGTPQNEMSLYNALGERGYETIIYPARYPYSRKHRDTYGSKLAPFIARKYDVNPEGLAGMPTDPDRFDEEDLTKREISYGKAGFMLQFMLDTTLSDAEKYPLKLRDFLVGMFSLEEAPMKLTWLPDPIRRLDPNMYPMVGLKGDGYYQYHTASPEMSKYTYKLLCIDPSGRGKDETGYSVLYYLNGYIYVMEVGGFTDGYSDDTLMGLAKIAKKYNVSQVVIEGNFGDGMFTKIFTPFLLKHHKCGIDEVKSHGQKEQRIIDTLEPVLMAHKLAILETAIKNDLESVPDKDYKYACLYQLSRITRDRGSLIHDDRLDALAIGVAFIKDMMDVNEDEGIKELNEKFIEDSLESFMHIVNRRINKNIISSVYDEYSSGVIGSYIRM